MKYCSTQTCNRERDTGTSQLKTGEGHFTNWERSLAGKLQISVLTSKYQKHYTRPFLRQIVPHEHRVALPLHCRRPHGHNRRTARRSRGSRWRSRSWAGCCRPAPGSAGGSLTLWTSPEAAGPTQTQHQTHGQGWTPPAHAQQYKDVDIEPYKLQ